jgi:trigger factor
LKIETHPREDHQITLIVDVEPEKLEGARRKAARRIAEKAKIPGFRPGKAPYDVVRRLYGDGVITEEAMELLVDEIYPLALKEADITPAAAGQLENIESMDPPKFIFTIPLAPTVDLGDYKAVRLPYEWTAPGDDNLEEEIINLRRMYSTRETVERAAQDGDFVSVDVTGVKAKAKEDEAPLVERNGFAVLVRTDEKEGEWPFPGFASKLIGAKPGENTSFAHKFAKDHEDETLQGQNVKFTVAVKTVRALNLPDLNDEFAQKTGLGQTVDELRQHMRENMEQESRNAYDDKYFEQALEQIKAGASIKYPPQVLEHEEEHVIEDVERRLKGQGVENLETYFKMVNTTKEQFIEEQARPTAQKRLERSLIMDEIARLEKIELDQQALEQEFNNAWATLAMNDEEFSKRTKGGTKPSREIVDAVAMDSAHRLLTRRTLETIKAIATGEAASAAAEPAEEKPAKKKKSKKAEEAPAPAETEPVAESEPVAEAPVAEAAPVKKTRKKKTE